MQNQIYTHLRKYVPFVKKIFEKDLPLPVGRWGNKSSEQVATAVDYNNVDHCGPCGTVNINNSSKKIDLNLLKNYERKRIN